VAADEIFFALLPPGEEVADRQPDAADPLFTRGEGFAPLGRRVASGRKVAWISPVQPFSSIFSALYRFF
jgi:hypothetical protein